MFRQDRANPGTRVSQWKGRHDTAKGWPGSRVSTWLNGGLFGGAAGFTAFGGIISQYVDSGDSKTYRVHTFRGSGKFYVAAGTADVDYLIVAGGGPSRGAYGYSGQNAASGGGGAGGVLTGTGHTVAAGTYAIVVGKGGLGAQGTGVGYAAAQDSTALGYTATKGGDGQEGGSSPGGDGGSGGGGGDGLAAGNQAGGGGGGFGGVGANQAGGDGPAGGSGTAGPPRQGYDGGTGGTSSLYGGNGGVAATGYGISETVRYYAAGGGGGGKGGGTEGEITSGSGTTLHYAGGGDGYATALNAPHYGGAVPNTGSGAGGIGAMGHLVFSYGGDGGAGIVLIRYDTGLT